MGSFIGRDTCQAKEKAMRTSTDILIEVLYEKGKTKFKTKVYSRKSRDLKCWLKSEALLCKQQKTFFLTRH